jgi:hypothetical protein
MENVPRSPHTKSLMLWQTRAISYSWLVSARMHLLDIQTR